MRCANPFFTNFARRTVRDETSVAHNYVRLKSSLRDEDYFVAQTLKCYSVDNPTLVPATPHIPHNCSPSSTPRVPIQIPEASDNPEVSTEPNLMNTDNLITNDIDSVAETRYQLPPKLNRGIPPDRFSPENSKKSNYPIANYVSTHRLSEACVVFANQMTTEFIPSKVQDALVAPQWKKAMDEKMLALKKNQTWDLVSLPQGKRPVGCRWIFTIKHKVDGTIDRYKARLVAKGYTQTYGVDYQETFAPVAKISTVRILISLAANLDWPLQQFDVKNAFLHGELKEEVYMNLPPGFDLSENPNLVCKLRKSLYGLKQSPRAWFGKFSCAMKKYGYRQSNADHTLFLKRRKGKVTVLIIYVDDMIITGDDTEEIDKLKHYLSTEFEMKDLGGLKYFLGIEVARSQQGIFLSQRKYVLDLLNETGMLGCKPADTPIVHNHNLEILPDQVPTNKDRYQRLVGRLIYLSHTRPDIAYDVSVVSQFMHSPSEVHMEAVMRILQYLKSAPGKGLMLSKHGHLEIEGFTDADWAGNRTDRRSTLGYFTFVGGNLVTWRSKKQKVCSLSSAEAKYRSMIHGVCEMLWIQKLLKELGFVAKDAMKLYCDN
ncbi:unnamed protein product [Prunus armeniaca]